MVNIQTKVNDNIASQTDALFKDMSKKPNAQTLAALEDKEKIHIKTSKYYRHYGNSCPTLSFISRQIGFISARSSGRARGLTS